MGRCILPCSPAPPCGASERGHSCPHRRFTHPTGGQKCPRSASWCPPCVRSLAAFLSTNRRQTTSNIQHRTLNIEQEARLQRWTLNVERFIVPTRVKSCGGSPARDPSIGARTFLSARWDGFGRAVSRILSAPRLRERESFVSAADTRNLSRDARRGAGRSAVPYLALHPMGFSVPPRLRLGRWALTPPFHPYPRSRSRGGLFSVALSVGTPRGVASRVYPRSTPGLRGIAPCGVRTFLPRLAPGAILRPSKTSANIRAGLRKTSGGFSGATVHGQLP